MTTTMMIIVTAQHARSFQSMTAFAHCDRLREGFPVNPEYRGMPAIVKGIGNPLTKRLF